MGTVIEELKVHSGRDLRVYCLSPLYKISGAVGLSKQATPTLVVQSIKCHGHKTKFNTRKTEIWARSGNRQELENLEERIILSYYVRSEGFPEAMGFELKLKR